MDLFTFGSNLITVMLGSGAAFGILNWFSERQKRTEEVEFLATRLAVQLEGYAIECADKVSDHDTATDSDNTAGAVIGKIPEFPPLPESESYRLLKRDLLDEMLQFPQLRFMAENAAIFWWNVVGDPDSCRVAYRDNTISMGERAAGLAKRLREKYSLPKRTLIYGEWDICKFFNEELAKIQKREERVETGFCH